MYNISVEQATLSQPQNLILKIFDSYKLGRYTAFHAKKWKGKFTLDLPSQKDFKTQLSHTQSQCIQIEDWLINQSV